MKALSFHQPRAAQIIQGEKTVDVRTWRTRYRGSLLVHASGTRRDARCRALGFAPDALAYGALIGTVTLTTIEPLDEAGYEALRDAHLRDDAYPGPPCYAWHLADPQPFATPRPYRGRMRLFNVDPSLFDEDLPSFTKGLPTEAQGASVEDLTQQSVNKPVRRRSPTLEASATETQRPLPDYRTTPPPEPDPAHPFVLYTVPESDGGYRIALYQWIQRDRTHDRQERPNARAPGAMWHVALGSDPLRAIADHLLYTLRANDYKATDLAPTKGREKSFYLDELTGIKLALIMLAVKPLRRHDRIEAIGRGIRAMGNEEAYYWFSKCSAGPDASRAQKALRVLLADE